MTLKNNTEIENSNKPNKKILIAAVILAMLVFVVPLVATRILQESNIEKVENSSETTVQKRDSTENTANPTTKNKDEDDYIKEIPKLSAPEAYTIPLKMHAYQTFNNCGPATLSMQLAYQGINVNQSELGNKMRPFQNSAGDNDDKGVFTSELAMWAEIYGIESEIRAIDLPNGDIDKLKLFVSNDMPVVLKTLLNSKEDIGHFTLIRGYNETSKTIIKDDSYYGPNIEISYDDLNLLWLPFNYSYVVLYNKAQAEIVKSILQEENDENVVWEKAVERAHKENELNPNNVYPIFNLSTGYYHLGDFGKSISYFESVESRLPGKMLWYQIEPIKSYMEVENYTMALQLIQNIMDNNNKAFSELYYLRGQIYLKQNNVAGAKEEFEKAVQYNSNYQPAIDALRDMK